MIKYALLLLLIGIVSIVSIQYLGRETADVYCDTGFLLRQAIENDAGVTIEHVDDHVMYDYVYDCCLHRDANPFCYNLKQFNPEIYCPCE